MGKHEMLPFKMVVERGRLVPATQHDAERLDTWQSGSKVNVTFVRDGGRVMERKWWAILGRAVKECRTPWKTSSEASEAIKLAIGVVNLTKTVGGDFLAYPKSLTELSDPELDDAVQQMIDVIYSVTGVDPEEWKKQVAHIRDDEPSSVAPTDETGSDADAPSPSVAADLTAQQGEAAAGDIEETHGADSSPAAELTDDQRHKLFLLDECAEAMFEAATYLVGAERTGRLAFASSAWAAELKDDEPFVKRAADICARLIENPAGRDAAMPFLKAEARKYLDSLIPARRREA